MKRFEDAHELATRLVEIGTACGTCVRALITDMSQPLGNAVGNALEVVEAIETLKGHGPRDLVELCRELTAHMFMLGGLEATLDGARARFDSLLARGQALEKFVQVVAAQGGDAKVVEDYSRLPRAQYEDSVVAPEDGHVAGLEAEALGRASMSLGAGRERLDSAIDPAVGLVLEKKVGDAVAAGERICALYANDQERLARAHAMVRSAIAISPEPVAPRPLILGRVPDLS
jgi:thymidine phosphorylase